MKKTSMVIPFFLVLFTGLISAQSLTQIGFVAKKAVTRGENFVVLCPEAYKDDMIRQARKAQVINQRQYHVFAVSKRSDIPRILPAVFKLKSPVVIIFGNSNALSPKSVKYVAEKVGLKGIPVITNRKNDTKQKALMVVLDTNGQVKAHINKVMAFVLKIEFPADFLEKAVIDVKRHATP